MNQRDPCRYKRVVINKHNAARQNLCFHLSATGIWRSGSLAASAVMSM